MNYCSFSLWIFHQKVDVCFSSLFYILNGNSWKLHNSLLQSENIHIITTVWLDKFWRSYCPFSLANDICMSCMYNPCYILKREFDKALHASLISNDDSNILVAGWLIYKYIRSYCPFSLWNMINWFECKHPPTFYICGIKICQIILA